MNNLNVVVMGQNCKRTLGLCLDSVKSADNLIYLDGGSDDGSINLAVEKGAILIENEYSQEDFGMNGKQRNYYLNYMKKNYPGWCLAIDADEVVEDLGELKEVIQKLPKGVYSVKMRHFIGNLGQEDFTQPEHFVLNRLFHTDAADGYQEAEHTVLKANDGFTMAAVKNTTIWHLSYIPNLWELKDKYENHLKKSNMHTKEFLKGWYYAHLFGKYPTKEVNPEEIPKIILNDFGIDKDEFYFSKRILESKHFLDALDWKNFFKCESVIEFGCGLGPRVYAMNKIGLNAKGIEISKYAVDNAYDKNIKLGNILNKIDYKSDLVVAYDVLEHLEYKDLNKAIDNLINSSKKYILISVPVIGDPNLEADKTHKIKETKEWWIKKFTNKELKLIKTPENFLFKEQLIIFKNGLEE